MKKILFIAIASLFSMAAIAAKPTTTVVKEKKVITVPADAKVSTEKKDGQAALLCVTIEYSDGSSITICCSNCTITIIF